MNKKIIVLVVCAIMAFGAFAGYMVSDSKEELNQSSGNDVKENRISVHRMSDEDMETIRYEDMSIKMVGCIYDKETRIGIAEFEISGNVGEGERNGKISYNSGGNYWLGCDTGCANSYDSYMDEDVLHLCYAFAVTESLENDLRICLYTSYDGEIIELNSGFVIGEKYESDYVFYAGEDRNVVISPVGLLVKDVDTSLTSVTLTYDDGTIKNIDIDHHHMTMSTLRLNF